MDSATYFASAVSYASKMVLKLTNGYRRPSSNAAQIRVSVFFLKITKYVVGNNEASH